MFRSAFIAAPYIQSSSMSESHHLSGAATYHIMQPDASYEQEHILYLQDNPVDGRVHIWCVICKIKSDTHQSDVICCLQEITTKPVTQRRHTLIHKQLSC